MPEKDQVSDKKAHEGAAHILAALKTAVNTSKKRNFVQTWSFSLNLKGIDLKKPENRFNLDFVLPEERGKKLKVAVIADTLAPQAKKCADTVITKPELEALSKNKKKVKKLSESHDFFLAEAPLMPQIAKLLGTVLGPRGKMPRPIPPTAKVEPLVAAARKTARISLKESPTIHVSVGTDAMENERVAKNIEAAYNVIREKLPKGKNNIKSMFIKLTMGNPVKLKI